MLPEPVAKLAVVLGRKVFSGFRKFVAGLCFLLLASLPRGENLFALLVAFVSCQYFFIALGPLALPVLLAALSPDRCLARGRSSKMPY